MIDDLQQQIAQLAGEFAVGLPVDGVGNLVCLFNRVGRDGGEGLGNVPGAARVRVAQAAHDRQEAGQAAIGVMDQGVWVYGH